MNKRFSKNIFSVIFALSLALPSVLAEAHSVKSDLSAFARIFTGIFSGAGPDTIVSNVVQAIPLFGLIVIVYGLAFFIAKITLFDKVEHDRYAKMFALGLTLIGIAQQGVYNAILGWSRTFLVLSFIIAIVFMFIIFLHHSNKRNYEVAKDKLTAKKDYLPVKAEVTKLKHDLNQQENEYGHVDSELSDLKTQLSDIDRLTGSERADVEKLIDLLRKAQSASHMGANETATKEYAHVLSTGIHALITSMNHEPRHIKKLQTAIYELGNELKKWGHDLTRDVLDIKSDEVLLEKLAHSYSNKPSKNLLGALKNDDALLRLISELKMALKEVLELYRNLKHKEKTALNHSFDDKMKLAERARSQINFGDFASAEGNLRKLHEFIRDEEMLLGQVRSDDLQISHALNTLKSKENDIDEYVRSHHKIF